MARGPILIFFLLLVCTFFIETQSTELKTTLSRSQITVGERINFTVNANIPKTRNLLLLHLKTILVS